jgi:hypothetical protein
VDYSRALAVGAGLIAVVACAGVEYAEPREVADAIAGVGLECVSFSQSRDLLSSIGACDLSDGRTLELIVFEKRSEQQRFVRDAGVILEGTANNVLVARDNVVVLAPDRATARRVRAAIGGEITDAATPP